MVGRFIYEEFPQVQVNTLNIYFSFFSLKIPRISEDYNVDVEQQRIEPLSGFSGQVFIFLRASSDLLDEKHNQCSQKEEAIVLWLINGGRRCPLDR